MSVQGPMPIQVLLQDLSITIGKLPNGDTLIKLLHPAGWEFSVPMDDETRRSLVRGLTGGIEMPR